MVTTLVVSNGKSHGQRSLVGFHRVTESDVTEHTCPTCVCMLSCFGCVQLIETLWAIAHWAPLSMGLSRQEYTEWVAMPSSRGSSLHRDQTHFS